MANYAVCETLVPERLSMAENSFDVYLLQRNCNISDFVKSLVNLCNIGLGLGLWLGQCWICQIFPEGGRIEAPKAPMGVWCGEGVSPSPLG